MKVIDIMQKVANGEIFEFKIGPEKYYVDKDHNICESDGYKLQWYIYSEWLNTEVEIIEDKKIETIDPIDYCHSTDTSKDMVLVEKINEIIHFINKDNDN